MEARPVLADQLAGFFGIGENGHRSHFPVLFNLGTHLARHGREGIPAILHPTRIGGRVFQIHGIHAGQGFEIGSANITVTEVPQRVHTILDHVAGFVQAVRQNGVRVADEIQMDTGQTFDLRQLGHTVLEVLRGFGTRRAQPAVMLTIIELYIQAGLAQGVHLVPIGMCISQAHFCPINCPDPCMQLNPILLREGQRRLDDVNGRIVPERRGSSSSRRNGVARGCSATHGCGSCRGRGFRGGQCDRVLWYLIKYFGVAPVAFQ